MDEGHSRQVVTISLRGTKAHSAGGWPASETNTPAAPQQAGLGQPLRDRVSTTKVAGAGTGTAGGFRVIYCMRQFCASELLGSASFPLQTAQK